MAVIRVVYAGKALAQSQSRLFGQVVLEGRQRVHALHYVAGAAKECTSRQPRTLEEQAVNFALQPGVFHEFRDVSPDTPAEGVDSARLDPLPAEVPPLLFKQLYRTAPALLERAASHVCHGRPGRTHHAETLFPDAKTIVDVEEILGMHLIQPDVPAACHVDQHHCAAERLNVLWAVTDAHHMCVMPGIVRLHNYPGIGEIAITVIVNRSNDAHFRHHGP